MTLVSVRSTTSQNGLVAILVEDGGPAMVAVPVTPREGLLLSSGEASEVMRTLTWTTLLGQTCRALGGRVSAVELDVDADAALCASVYECTSADEVIDLVQGGQGVFGIAVGRVWHEVEGSLSELPVDHANRPPVIEDELAKRRAAKCRLG